MRVILEPEELRQIQNFFDNLKQVGKNLQDVDHLLLEDTQTTIFFREGSDVPPRPMPKTPKTGSH